jgi:hypothetical protein
MGNGAPPRKNGGTERAIPPAEVPADAIERILPRRLVKPETGDVVLLRESAAREHLTVSMWRYRLTVVGERETQQRLFARYDTAAAEGEHLAARRKVRLFYVEDSRANLLMDHRPV